MYVPSISKLMCQPVTRQDVQQPPADQDIDKGGPCLEDEEFFDALPDAAAMEKAIGKFMDCMEEP
jgi:hypothetical protein